MQATIHTSTTGTTGLTNITTYAAACTYAS